MLSASRRKKLVLWQPPVTGYLGELSAYGFNNPTAKLSAPDPDFALIPLDTTPSTGSINASSTKQDTGLASARQSWVSSSSTNATLWMRSPFTIRQSGRAISPYNLP
ncbi:hypothetical protein T265_00096 [Opisthorchis viverrini]|uniref:Uncharacterized protein n=1 Tax=Opisthorchis viverrini TaxID=6198 RepID=A0A075A4F9_OPIVI|nr:hypothetical protein T265_00096 [Opisthorchis viverrini]KER34246.1 hypothetical protein T265_00096 [Opisthorchis viverrini]